MSNFHGVQKVERLIRTASVWAVLFSMVFSFTVSGIQIANAAALTGTNVQPVSLVAGATGNVQVTFTTVGAVAQTGKIKITFPAGFAKDTGGTTAPTNNVIGGTTYVLNVGESTGQTIVLIGDGVGTGIGAGATVTNLTLSNFRNPQFSGATGTYTIETTTGVDAQIDVNPGVTPDVITAGALSSTNVQPATLVAGATGTSTATFTTANPIPVDGVIKITFGTNFDVSGANAGTCSTMDGTFATTISGQTVILTRTGTTPAAAGAQTCTIAGIKNPAFSGTTGIYGIATYLTGGTTGIDVDANVTADTITVGALSSTNVQPATLVAGATGTSTATFTTANPIPVDGVIKITFGTNFDVSGANAGTCSTMDGTFATTISGQTVILTRTGTTPAAAGAQTCTIAGIKNPAFSGTTGIYGIATYLTGGTTGIDVDANVTADTITDGAITAASVVPAQLSVSATPTQTITFTTANPIPNLGKIVVTYPTGFAPAGANTLTAGSLSGLNGTWTASVTGQVVTFTQTAGTLTAPGVKSFTIAGIRNPGFAGPTGTYTITTTTAANVEIDTKASVTGSYISGGGGGGGSHDSTPPTNGSVAIIGEPAVPTSDVQLTLAATDATQMIISNYADFSGGEQWESYTTIKDWTLLSGTGTRTVYVKFRDAAYNSTEVFHASITVNASAPSPTHTSTQETQASTQETQTSTQETQSNTQETDTTTGFTDTTNHWAHDYINQLFTMGAISGKTSTTFAPDDLLTRAEIVKIAVLTFKIEVTDGSTPSFKDVSASDWSAKYIAAAETAGIVSGYGDGTFQPNKTVNRAEALKIILIASGKTIGNSTATPFTDVPADAWFAKYVSFAFTNGVVSGKTDTTFAPDDNITRGEIAKIAVKASEL